MPSVRHPSTSGVHHMCSSENLQPYLCYLIVAYRVSSSSHSERSSLQQYIYRLNNAAPSRKASHASALAAETLHPKPNLKSRNSARYTDHRPGVNQTTRHYPQLPRLSIFTGSTRDRQRECQKPLVAFCKPVPPECQLVAA